MKSDNKETQMIIYTYMSPFFLPSIYFHPNYDKTTPLKFLVFVASLFYPFYVIADPMFEFMYQGLPEGRENITSFKGNFVEFF